MAERLDDLICSFDVPMADGIESYSVLVIGWVLFLAISALGLQAFWRFGKSRKQKKNETVRRPDDQIGEQKKSLNCESSGKNDTFDSYFMSKVRSALPFKEAVSQRLSSTQSSVPCEFTVPSASGDDCNQVEWVNNVINFILKNGAVKNDIVSAWIESLNDKSVERATENGVNLRFIDLICESSSIEISSVNVETSSEDSLSVEAQCTCKLCLTVSVTCHRSPTGETSTGGAETWRPLCRVWARLVTPTRLAFTVLQHQQLVIGRLFSASPQVEVDVHADETCSDSDWSPLQERVDLQCISKAVSACLSSAVTNFYYSKYDDWPKVVSRRHQRSLQSTSNFRCQSVDPAVSDPVSGHQVIRRLLVRVVKASALRPVGGRVSPVCVVEMDEPLQRFQSQPASDRRMPFWNEEFVFDLSANTAEILFELFAAEPVVTPGRSSPAGAAVTSSRRGRGVIDPNDVTDAEDDDGFLGLGIVGVDELLVSPSQRQIITLMSRPGRRDPVTGTLTVEFLFVDEKSRSTDVVSLSNCETGQRHMSERVLPSGNVLHTTHTTYSLPKGVEDSSYVTNMALDNMKATAKPNATKSTLIIHSSKKENVPRGLLQVERNEDGLWVEVSMKDDSVVGEDQAASVRNDYCPDGSSQLLTVSNSVSVPDPDIDDTTADDKHGMVVQRRRSGMFGSLRKRFGSMRKDRKNARNVDRASSAEPFSLSESLPLDKQGAHPLVSTLTRTHKSGKRLSTGTFDRKSLGAVSVVSDGSDSSFMTEKSSLVIETKENGILRHFMVPSSSASQYKHGKKFSKLHIYNEHIFIAKHVSHARCGVCEQPLSRWIGKQAYQCRDCQLCVHKHCHVLVQTACPNTTVHTMQMSVVPEN